MKRKNIIISIISVVVVVILIIMILFLTGVFEKKEENVEFSKGVWWWSVTEEDEVYLDFAKQNQVNEIYYCNSDFDENVDSFIEKANARGIDVYFLCGEYQWIDDKTSFDEVMQQYLEFQSNYDNNFSGVHLDVEPHQHPQWKAEDSLENKLLLIERYIGFVEDVTTCEDYENVQFDFDIPFWYDDYVVSYKGQTQEAYKFVIDFADRVFVMSYRDEADRILSSAIDEMKYSNEVNKKIFLSVETSDQSAEDENISFFEEGKLFMNGELEKLKTLIAEEFGNVYKGYGFSIHHMRSWYELKD